WPDRPVRGIVRPFSAGWFRTLSAVSPLAICHMISPLFRSIALMCEYGGFSSGRPWTVRPPPPSPPAAGAATAAPAVSPVRPPPADEPEPPVRRAPVTALP